VKVPHSSQMLATQPPAPSPKTRAIITAESPWKLWEYGYVTVLMIIKEIVSVVMCTWSTNENTGI
jgi:hypothetical protein